MYYDLFLIPLYIVVLLYVVVSSHKPFFINPFHIALFFLSNMLLGSMDLFDFTVEADVVNYQCMIFGIFMLVVGNAVGHYFFPTRNLARAWESRHQNTVERGIVYDYLVYALIFFSLAVCVLYYVKIGFNLLLLGMLGQVEDAATMRLETYQTTSSGNYYAPGYVNQFKNVLLPILLGYMWFKFYLQKNSSFIQFLILFICTITGVVVILGTGQRAPFVKAYIMVLMFIYTVLKSRKSKFRVVSLNVLFVIIVFGLMSLLIGRSNVSEDTNFISSTVEALWHRITDANQASGIYGFRYIYEKPIQWGGEWIQAFLGILPSHTGSTLSSEVAMILWGGRGTAPVTIWGSIYYNFGFLGALYIPLILGIVHQYFYHRMFTKPKDFYFRTMCYTAFFFILGSWAVGTPMYFVNLGLVAIVVLRYLYQAMTMVLGSKRIKLS